MWLLRVMVRVQALEPGCLSVKTDSAVHQPYDLGKVSAYSPVGRD